MCSSDLRSHHLVADLIGRQCSGRFATAVAPAAEGLATAADGDQMDVAALAKLPDRAGKPRDHPARKTVCFFRSVEIEVGDFFFDLDGKFEFCFGGHFSILI